MFNKSSGPYILKSLHLDEPLEHVRNLLKPTNFCLHLLESPVKYSWSSPSWSTWSSPTWTTSTARSSWATWWRCSWWPCIWSPCTKLPVTTLRQYSVSRWDIWYGRDGSWRSEVDVPQALWSFVRKHLGKHWSLKLRLRGGDII